MNAKTLFLLIAILFIPLRLSAYQEWDEDRINRKIQPVLITRKNVHEVLFQMTSLYKVPIAMEVTDIKQNEEGDGGPASIQAETIKQVLNATIVYFPDYRWSWNDGVINIKSAATTEPLLDTVISDFEVSDKTIDEIKQALYNRREVRQVLSEKKSEILEPKLNSDSSVSSSRYSISLHDKSVREILNCLIKRTDRKYWTITRWGAEKEDLWIII